MRNLLQIIKVALFYIQPRTRTRQKPILGDEDSSEHQHDNGISYSPHLDTPIPDFHILPCKIYSKLFSDNNHNQVSHTVLKFDTHRLSFQQTFKGGNLFFFGEKCLLHGSTK